MMLIGIKFLVHFFSRSSLSECAYGLCRQPLSKQLKWLNAKRTFGACWPIKNPHSPLHHHGCLSAAR